MEPRPDRDPTDEERQKWLAEARKADAEARKADAEAARLAAEEAKYLAETRVADALGEMQQIGARKALREEAEHLSANQYHRIYHFTDSVSSASIHAAMKQIDIWRRHAEEPIEIVFTSPGGSVIDGMVFFDYLQKDWWIDSDEALKLGLVDELR